MSPPTPYAISADGRTGVFQITLPADHDVLGILVEPSPPWERPDLCFQLEEVTTDEGETWVPAASAPEEWGRTCGDCDQRVFLTWGSGFYLFPNGAEPLSPGTGIQGRVALRDCLSRLPVSETVDGPLPPTVDVSWASWKEPPEDAPLYLPVHLVVASALLEEPQPSPVASAVQYATDLLSQAGVLLSVHGESTVTDPGPLTVSMGDPSPLSALFPQMGITPGAVAVIFTPCLTLSNEVLGTSGDPDGFTLRIPGGYGGAQVADGVFIRVANCFDSTATYGTDPTHMGTLIAHELGHYLGLYHPPDHLPDTGDGDTLMEESPLGVESPILSPSQIQVLRRHPFLLPVIQGSSEAGM